MNYLKYVPLLFLLPLIAGGSIDETGGSETDPPPNIILIMADDLGFSDLGAYGSEIQTPHLDQLADEGALFTQFYNLAKCTQTRAALLTGLYHQQTNNLSRSDNNATLAEVLGERGYDTILSGKWHLGRWQQEKDRPTDRGFQHFFGFLGGAINYYTGEDWGTGKNYMREGTRPFEVPEDFYATDAFTEYAIDRITASARKSRPFFLYLAYNAPHFPLQVPSEEREKYTEVYRQGWDRIRRSRYERQIGSGLIRAEWELSPRDTLVPSWDSLNARQKEEERMLMATYAGMVDRMDQQIGRLLQQVDRLGLKEHTVILFLSDNGGNPFDFNRTPQKTPGPSDALRSYNVEWANVSNTPFRKYKQWMHEGGTATPLIVRWPAKIAAGRVIRSPGHIVDLMPTILDMTGTRYPVRDRPEQALPLEGSSLLPILENGTGGMDRTLYWEFKGSRAVRKGPWKLVAERGRGWELYHLQTDRTEVLDLAGDHPGRVDTMSRWYDDWAKRVGARSNARSEHMRVNKRAAFTGKKQ